jgi:DNA-binding MarR family transcriptional regulator
MPDEELDEREFELINIIGPQVTANQRDLSRQMNLSLGMVNMLIRRLITKGLIRTRQLNKKKIEYIITPKGFSEKMRKSVQYTVKTINSISNIKEGLNKIIQRLVSEGETEFYILGRSDFAHLVDMAIQEYSQNRFKGIFIEDVTQDYPEGILLVCKENVGNGHWKVKKAINLIEELAKANAFAERP